MRVLVFGTFDLLHEGHKSLFEQARSLAPRVELHAVVARDDTVRDVKGYVPTHDERTRLLAVSEYVDHVHLGREGDKYAIIEEIDPQIIALGYDQTHFVEGLDRAIASRNLNSTVVRLEAFRPDVFKTSLIRSR